MSNSESFDRSDFTPDQIALWDEMFPDGINHETSDQDSSQIRLYSFAYIAMLDGRVPKSVMEALGDTPQMVNEYLANRRRGA